MSQYSESRDFEFLKLLLNFKQQNYYELKEECIRKGVLFEDDTFPANSDSYYLKSSAKKSNQKWNVEWLRPSQILSNDEENQPRFIHSSNFACWKKAESTLLSTSQPVTNSKSFKFQLNVSKGKFGSVNFISALSILYWNHENFVGVVPIDQSFDNNYAGIFHFRIWQYGKWYDIVIDDRLPTINGQLIQVQTHRNLDFWPALLEKAFAKLNGSYQSLQGCAVSEFLEDMSGGLCENINSEMSDLLNEGLFQTFSKSLEQNSHIVVKISAKENSIKQSEKSSIDQKAQRSCIGKRQLPNGLIKNQSYIILDTKIFYLRSDNVVHLIKMCNPWKRINQMTFPGKCKCVGNEQHPPKGTQIYDGKWTGIWSENSLEWINIPDDVKIKFGLSIDSDNEFWMPIESFIENFTDIDICHIAVENGAKDNLNVNTWNSFVFNGYWLTGVSAGGCYNESTFHQNPIYLVPIQGDKQKSTKDAVEVCQSGLDSKNKSTSQPTYTILIGLMQKYRNLKRLSGLHDLKIGFHLFKLEYEDLRYIQEIIHDDEVDFKFNQRKINSDSKVRIMVKMKPEFFHLRKGEHAIQYFTNIREVSARYKLTEGNYLLIPSTYGPNCDGNFLLRLYSEVRFKFFGKELMSLINSDIDNSETNRIPINKTYFLNRMFSRPIEKVGSLDESLDVENLEVLLKSVITSKRNYFSLDQCLAILALYDLECKGKLSYVQLQQLCIDIDECYQLFLKHDKTGSRTISSSELKAALVEVGINVNQRVVKMLVNRYGSNVKIVVKGVPIREIKFTNFAICLLKLRKALIYWDVKSRNCSSLAQAEQKSPGTSSDKRTNVDINSSNFSLLEFVEQIIYS